MENTTAQNRETVLIHSYVLYSIAVKAMTIGLLSGAHSWNGWLAKEHILESV